MSKTISFFFFQKLNFMEPSRVWYQVTPPDPSNNFCAPPENQLMPWNVSDGPWQLLCSRLSCCRLMSCAITTTPHARAPLFNTYTR